MKNVAPECFLLQPTFNYFSHLLYTPALTREHVHTQTHKRFGRACARDTLDSHVLHYLVELLFCFHAKCPINYTLLTGKSHLFLVIDPLESSTGAGIQWVLHKCLGRESKPQTRNGQMD